MPGCFGTPLAGQERLARYCVCRTSHANRSRLCRKSDRLSLYVPPHSLRFVFAIVTTFTFGGSAKEYFQGARNIERGLRPLVPRSFYWRLCNGNRTTVQRRHRQATNPKSRQDDPPWLLDFGNRFPDRNVFCVDVVGNSTRRFRNDDRVPVSAQRAHANRSRVHRLEKMPALAGGGHIRALFPPSKPTKIRSLLCSETMPVTVPMD